VGYGSLGNTQFLKDITQCLTSGHFDRNSIQDGASEFCGLSKQELGQDSKRDSPPV
jgi:hypothetical protein